MEVVNTNTFKSNQTEGASNICYAITWKIHLIIYLLECMRNPKGIPVCIYFRKEGHTFIQIAKFTLIEQLTEMER